MNKFIKLLVLAVSFGPVAMRAMEPSPAKIQSKIEDKKAEIAGLDSQLKTVEKGSMQYHNLTRLLRLAKRELISLEKQLFEQPVQTKPQSKKSHPPAKPKSTKKTQPPAQELTEEEQIELALAKSLEEKSEDITEEELIQAAIEQSLQKQKAKPLTQKELDQIQVAIAKSQQKKVKKSDVYSWSNFTQLESAQQEKSTCGFWTLINAKSIFNLIEAGEPITDENVLNQAVLYAYLEAEQIAPVKLPKGLSQEELEAVRKALPSKAKFGEELECPRIIGLAELLKLKNLYILNFDYKDGQVLAIEKVGTVKSINTFFNSFKLKLENYAFFAAHLGGHWVLIALIRDAQDQPHMYYLDSLNNQVRKNSLAEQYILYINQKIQ